MSDLKKRLKRFERAQRKGLAIVIINHGETGEEAWQRYLPEHPGAEEPGAAKSHPKNSPGLG